MTIYAILGGAVGLFLVGFVIWLMFQRERTTGATLEAAKGDAVTVKAEAAIAQAEVSAPATDKAVEDRLSRGTF